MKDILFDTPFWMLAGLAIVGISLFVAGNNRVDRTLRNVGLGVMAAGLLLFLMSWLVDTDKEKCVKNTRALVHAVQERDWPTFEKLVSPRCTVRLPVAGVVYRSKDELRKATEIAADKFGLRNNTVTGVQVNDTGDFIKIGLGVLSEGNIGAPLVTSWELEWQDTDNGWELTDLNALRIGNDSGSEMQHHFPNVSK